MMKFMMKKRKTGSTRINNRINKWKKKKKKTLLIAWMNNPPKRTNCNIPKNMTNYTKT